MTTRLLPVAMIIALAWLHSVPPVFSAPVNDAVAVDAVDLSGGVRQYLQLMAASLTKGFGYSGESNVNTYDSAQYKIDMRTDEGKDALNQMDLQSMYMDNELGEKNLMWSLRGSQSDKSLRNNLGSTASNEEVPSPIYFRRLADITDGWITRMINAAYDFGRFDERDQELLHNMSPEVRRTAHQTSIYFKH